MARSFPHPSKIIFFDVETGGELKKRASTFDFSTFFKRSQEANWLHTPEATFHANNPLLQLHATNIPYFHASDFSHAPRSSFIKAPSKPWVVENGERVSLKISSWARDHKLVSDAATQTEEEALRGFFQGIESNIARDGKAYLGGWNVGYDIGAIERASRRYAGLSQYHGFMGRMHEAGQLEVVQAEDVMMDVALQYGKHNQNFANKYLRMGSGKIAETPEEMRKVAGWSLGNVMQGRMNTLGIAEEDLHTAFFDTKLTEAAYEDWSRLHGYLEGGVEFDRAFKDVFGETHSAESVLSKIYNNPRLDRKLEDLASAGEKMGTPGARVAQEIEFAEVNWKRIGYTAAAVAAVGLASRLAFGKRRDRQTQITGLSDDGLAADSRHEHSDFGSGWQGLKDKKKVEWKYVAGMGAGYGAYRTMSAAFPSAMHGAIQGALEEKGFNLWKGFGRALSLSHLSASYIPEELAFSTEQIVDEAGNLTGLGSHFERLFGKDFNLGKHAADNGGLKFKRGSQWSPYMGLEGTEYEARFVGVKQNAGWVPDPLDAAKSNAKKYRGSRWSGASSRWGAPIRPNTWVPPEPTGNPWQRWKTSFRNQVKSRKPWDPSFQHGTFHGAEADGMLFQPLFGRKAGSRWQSLKQSAGILSLEMMERPQRLFAKIGLGVKSGSWNSALGLGGRLLTRVALPAAAGALALDYADYKSGHRLFGSIAGIIPKARIAHAELTDRIPGARKTTDWYAEHVPGPWYGPAMLPVIGLGLGKVAAGVTSSRFFTLDGGAFKNAVAQDFNALWSVVNSPGATVQSTMSAMTMPRMKNVWAQAGKINPAKVKNWGTFGMVAGLVAMAPFVPGMLGSRKTAHELRETYAGREPVAVRSGRWWELNNTPWKGRRISMYRSSWYARLLTRPERTNTWGSEKEYWAHHPVLHPFKWLKNPYALEEHNAENRPYPMASPAGSNIPLIGPIVAATIGRLLKPPKRMHENEWDGSDYILNSPRVEPRGPDALAPAAPREEYRSLGEVARREGEIAAELVGLPGWGIKTLLGNAFNRDHSKEVFFQGSRQMTSWARRYHDQEFGAGFGPIADASGTDSYTEPFRRFVQKDIKTNQANEIPNQMPNWLPGHDYMIDFKHGDPYTKIASGSSRLPGPGYEALHPEMKDVPYDQYSRMERFRILSDVAPWSTQWFQHQSMLEKDTQGDTEARIEFEKIKDRAEKLKASSEDFEKRRYSTPVETLEGTVKTAGLQGIELEEMPGRRFHLSAIGMKAADLSSVVLGEKNSLTRAQVAREVDSRHQQLARRFSDLVGNKVKLVAAKGTSAHADEAQAVLFSGGKNFNQDLLDSGLALKRSDQAGAEFRAMSGPGGKIIGRLAESTAFEGDLSFINPMHWVASKEHSKMWQERTAIEQYKHHEVYGARIQRWEKPIKSFLGPWKRGFIYRATGRVTLPGKVQERRDLDTLTDQLEYLRGLNSYTNKNTRSAVGADVTGSPTFLRSVLSGRDKYYFESFLAETSDKKRRDILNTVPEDFGRIIQGQWIKKDAQITGQSAQAVTEGGRLKTKEKYEEFEQAKEVGETKLNYGDWERSKEVANFFFRRNIRLPDSPDSPVFDENIDYEDVKLKIIQEEGLDAHDFNIFDDRAAVLWRKPYVDGAVRELTTGNDRKPEELRRAVEQMIRNKAKRGSLDVRLSAQSSHQDRTNITLTLDADLDREILDDVRRHKEEYQDQQE